MLNSFREEDTADVSLQGPISAFHTSRPEALIGEFSLFHVNNETVCIASPFF